MYVECEAEYTLVSSNSDRNELHLPCYSVSDDSSSFGRAKLAKPLWDTVRVLPTLGRGQQCKRANNQTLIQTMREYQIHQFMNLSVQKILHLNVQI